MAKAKRLSLALIVTSVLLGLLMVVTAGFATPVAAAEETAPFTVKTFDMDRTECVDLTTSLYSDYVFYGEYYGKAVYRKPGVTNSGIVETREFDNQNNLYDNIPFVSHDTGFHRNGTYSHQKGDQWNHEVTVSGKGKIVMFANGYDGNRPGEAIITVTDGDGNSKTVSVGTQYNWYSKIEIAYDEATSDTYTIVFENSFGNCSIAAVAIQPDLGLGYEFSAERGSTEKFVDLTTVGNQDWLHFNSGDSYEQRSIRKNLPAEQRMISDITKIGDSTWHKFWDYKHTLYYGDGISGSEDIANVSTWSSCFTDGIATFDVKVNDKTEYIKVYYSSYKNGLGVTIKDGETVIYDNIDVWMGSSSTGFARCMVYKVNLPEGVTKTLTFEIDNAISESGNVAVSAVAVGYEQDAPATVHAFGGDVADYNGGDNLTTLGTKDWFHFGNNTNENKASANYFGKTYGSDIIGHSGVNEYKSFSWTDGEGTATATDVKTLSPCKNGSQTSINLKAGEAVTLKLYIGLREARGNLRITDANGNIVVDKNDLEAGDATFKTITYTLCSGIDQTLRISLLTRERINDNSGVVYLVAGTLTGATINHNWDAGVITKEATCHSLGEMTYTCKDCTIVKTEDIDTIPHVFDKMVESSEYFDSAATCSKKTTYFYSCYCGEKGDKTFEVGDYAGEHIYQCLVSPYYIAAHANCQHLALYYESCVNCGLKGTNTFEDGALGDCEYAVKVVTLANLVKKATCTTPATYYYTCECGAVSDSKTFTYGATADHNFTNKTATADTLATGPICSADATYYYTCADCGAMGTETFSADTAIGDHNFNKQIVNDTTKATDATCTAVATYYYTCACGAVDTNTFGYGKLAPHDFSKKEATSATLISPATCTATAVYYLTCTDCGATGNKDYTFENGKPNDHTYNRAVAIDATKATDATCTKKATYYYTCLCGAMGTKTFSAGSELAHTYINKVNEDYKVSGATCTEQAVYNTLCKDCGLRGTDTFSAGETIAHTYDQAVATDATKATDATCTTLATYYKTCACGAIGTETFEDGETLAHVYDKSVAKPEYILLEASCTEKAIYYKSCACGAFDEGNRDNDNVFEAGALLPHVFDREVKNDMYLRNPATCTLKKTYFKTCKCGAKSTYETFEDGELGDHTWNAGVETRPATSEAEGVKTYTCTSCGETKTESIDKLASSEINYSGGCGTVMPVSNNNDHTGGTALMIVSLLGIAAVMFAKKKRAK